MPQGRWVYLENAEPGSTANIEMSEPIGGEVVKVTNKSQCIVLNPWYLCSK